MDLRPLIRLLLVEARKKEDLEKAFEKFRKNTKGWVTEGWDRNKILSEIDPSFIHHAEHFDALLHGGSRKNGSKFSGGGGLQWGGMVITEGEALLRVMGSFEYKSEQEIYQQTLGFSNFKKIAEAKEFNWIEKARLLIGKDTMKVHCDCDAYAFYHQHAATNKGFALIPEDRAAPINNPDGRGGACKHLNVTLKWLGAQAPKMASEMKDWYESKGKK